MPKAKRIKEKEYEGGIFVIEFPEGGDIAQMYPRLFTAWGGTIDRESKHPVRIFLKCVGFQDDNAKVRNWGYTRIPKVPSYPVDTKTNTRLLETLEQLL